MKFFKGRQHLKKGLEDLTIFGLGEEILTQSYVRLSWPFRFFNPDEESANQQVDIETQCQ